MAAKMKLRDLEIPRPTNVSWCIQITEDYGRFELKKCMVQICTQMGSLLVLQMTILQSCPELPPRHRQGA